MSHVYPTRFVVCLLVGHPCCIVSVFHLLRFVCYPVKPPAVYTTHTRRKTAEPRARRLQAIFVSARRLRAGLGVPPNESGYTSRFSARLLHVAKQLVAVSRPLHSDASPSLSTQSTEDAPITVTQCTADPTFNHPIYASCHCQPMRSWFLLSARVLHARSAVACVADPLGERPAPTCCRQPDRPAR